jgi:hypothetical protein
MPWTLASCNTSQFLWICRRGRILSDLSLQRYFNMEVGQGFVANLNVDNNPMLRDGVTGDWYAKQSRSYRQRSYEQDWNFL